MVRSARSRRRVFTGISVGVGMLLVVMTYFPIVFVLSNSLKTGKNLVTSGVFALFTQFDAQNYATAWSGIDTSLLNTVIVALLSVAIGVTAAALGAYAFSELQFRGKGVLFMAYLGLLMIPWTLTIIPLFLMIRQLGLFNSMWALVLPYAASAQPLLVLLFRGFFEQIPRDLLQSARVDGAKERQVLLRVVAPLTRPIILTGTILMTINIWGDYIWPEVAIQDYHHYTISAGLQEFISSLNMSGSSAGAVFAAYMIALLPLVVLVAFTMRYFVSGLTEGALKV